MGSFPGMCAFAALMLVVFLDVVMGVFECWDT